MGEFDNTIFGIKNYNKVVMNLPAAFTLADFFRFFIQNSTSTEDEIFCTLSAFLQNHLDKTAGNFDIFEGVGRVEAEMAIDDLNSGNLSSLEAYTCNRTALTNQFGKYIHSLSKTSPSEAGRLGGSNIKYDKDLQEAINKIYFELTSRGDPLTEGTFQMWLRKNLADTKFDNMEPFNFSPPLPGCQELYIDGNKLVYKKKLDKMIAGKEIALSSLRTYFKRAKSPA